MICFDCWLLPGVVNFETMKKVNIILPTHNGMRYLESALKSCLDQTYPNIEIIIVTTGRVTERLIILTVWTIRQCVIHHPTNYGLPQALNTGFAAADGDYLYMDIG